MTGPFKALKDFQWDLALPPVAPGTKPANVLVANTSALGRDSKAPDAAWALVAFVAGSKRGQALNSRSGLAVPTMPAVANSPEFKNLDLPMQGDVFLRPIDYAQWGPRHTAWPDLQQVLTPALNAVWRGEKRAIEALREVEPQITELLKKS